MGMSLLAFILVCSLRFVHARSGEALSNPPVNFGNHYFTAYPASLAPTRGIPSKACPAGVPLSLTPHGLCVINCSIFNLGGSSMAKEDLAAIIRKLLRTEAYLDFLLALDENDLRTLIAGIRERLDWKETDGMRKWGGAFDTIRTDFCVNPR